MHCGYQGGNLVQVPLSEHADTHINTHTHLTSFTVLSYNPICRGRVSLMTWQPAGFFIYYLATQDHIYSELSRGDTGPQLLVSRCPSSEVNCSEGQTSEKLIVASAPVYPSCLALDSCGTNWSLIPTSSALSLESMAALSQWRVCVCVCARW